MGDRRDAFERVPAPEPGRTALVVVDMQRGFLDPDEAMPVPPAREIVPVIQGLLSLLRARGLPVAFTKFVYSERRRGRLAVSACHRRRAWSERRAPTPSPSWRERVRSWRASAATTASPAHRLTRRSERGT